jgi:4-amino-4-deoxy-L-arabinose transferase-like glycosyltransferase
MSRSRFPVSHLDTALIILALCGLLVMLIGGLAAADHGLNRVIGGPDGYTRTFERWPWPFFDGADYTWQDDQNRADRVRFAGYLWQGAPGETTWRIVHAGNITVRVDDEMVFSAEGAQSRSVAAVPVRWEGAALRLEIEYSTPPAAYDMGGVHLELGVYQRALWGGWELLPTHRLYPADPDPALAAREILIYRLTHIALAAMVFALGLLLSRRLWRGEIWRRREFWIPAILTALALVVRLAVLTERAANDEFLLYLIPGSDNYVLLARETLAGQSHIAGAFFAPGNTIWSLALMRLLGPGLWGLYLVNAIVGAASIPLIAAAGRLAFNRRAGLLAGLIAALFPPLIFYHTTLQIAAPLSALTAGAAWLGLRALRQPTGSSTALFGISLGLLALFRLTVAVIGVAFALALLAGRDSAGIWPRLRRAAIPTLIAAVFAALTILPQTLANYSVGQRHVINANGPPTLYWALNRDGNGADIRGQAWFAVGARGGDYTSATLQDLHDYPRRTAELLLHKWGLFWSNTDIANNVDYHQQGLGASGLLRLLALNNLWGTSALLLLGLTGLGANLLDRDRRSPALWFLLWSVLLITLGSIVFTVFGRMRAPLWPLLCIPAGGLLTDLLWRDFRLKTILVAGGIALVLIGVTWGFKQYLPRQQFHGELPPGTIARVEDFNGEVRLLGYAPIEMNRVPGGYFYLTLYWQVITPHSEPAQLAIDLTGSDGESLYRHEIYLGQVTYPDMQTPQWPPGSILEESYLLPIPDDPPPLIGLEISLYEARSIRLAELEVAVAPRIN